MEDGKLLSSLSYFSIFFAPVLLPFIVLLVSNDQVVKKHAKSSMLSQLIPLIFLPFLIFSIFSSVMTYDEIPVLFLSLIVLHVITSFIVLIWNVVRGVKVLAN